MSGKRICREGDISLGTCGKPAIPAISSTAINVLINNRKPIIVGSFWGTHCDDGCHSEYGIVGNSTVLVNGKPIITVGAVLSKGDITGMGSYNVLA